MNKEKLKNFLQKSGYRYAILQMKEHYRNMIFLPYENLPQSLETKQYNFIYEGEMENSGTDSLKELYVKFNMDFPQDYNGRSMSVSDIIVIKYNDNIYSYYVDSIGFKPISEFTKKLKEILNV